MSNAPQAVGHVDTADIPVVQENRRRRLARLSAGAAVALFIATLAWVQFPLGSARPWAWSLLALVVCVNWLVWLPAGLIDFETTKESARRVALPGLLMLAVIAWAFVQAAVWTPASWHHPMSQIVHDALGVNAPGSISLNAYDTLTEAMKLLTYVAAGWLAYVLSVRHVFANRIFVALFLIGFAYALYGIVLSIMGTSQVWLLEGLPSPYGHDVTGAFVAKNSFATFAGMSFLIAAALLAQSGANNIVTARGWMNVVRTSIQFVFGPGVAWFIGAIVIFVALVASDSRAGLIATLLGLSVAFGFSLFFAARRQTLWWTLLGSSGALAAMVALFVIGGGSLAARFENLVETRGVEELRPLMWQAALRAIADHPLLGIGLGAYHDAYHLYADRFVPYVVDRAHNDYLELAAGLGLPAAAIWVFALAILVWQCARGALRRQRRRAYAVTAVAASVLVGVHSIFDFSLQIPAVSMMYAAILGVGVAQARGTQGA